MAFGALRMHKGTERRPQIGRLDPFGAPISKEKLTFPGELTLLTVRPQVKEHCYMNLKGPGFGFNARAHLIPHLHTAHSETLTPRAQVLKPGV